MLHLTPKKVYKLALIEAEKKGMITYHIAWDKFFALFGAVKI